MARKDPAAIFPVVDRLLAAGADLVEFANGMAELLRAVLMVATGAVPEGLTGVQRDVVNLAKEQLAAGDVLRMLGLLGQVETSIRRSANPRLVVETLLLRWALMDRTVDLEAVLNGAPAARPLAPAPAPRPAPRAPASVTVPPVKPAPAGPLPGLLTGPLTLEAVTGAWAGIVARARDKSPLLATVIEHLKPVGLTGNRLAVTPDDDATHMAEGAQRQLGAIEDAISSALGQRLAVSVGGPGATPGKPKRLSEKDLKAEKLREFRAKDATLDAAAEALDLEIVD